MFKQKQKQKFLSEYSTNALAITHTPTFSCYFSLSAIAVLVLLTSSGDTQANASCSTATTSINQSINQTGGECTYNQAQLTSSNNGVALIQLQQGATARFTALNLTLQKSIGTYEGSYAAIFLKPETKLKNEAIFEGQKLSVQTRQRVARDIIVGGGNELFIKGNLTLTHTNKDGGSMFALNADGSWGNARNDTKMQINGEVTAHSSTGSFIRMGNGEFTFANKVTIHAPNNSANITVFKNTSGHLKFQKEVIVENSSLFLDIKEMTTSTVTFNKFTINNDGHTDVFALRSGVTTIKGDSTFKAPKADAIKLYSTATFTNGGHLSVVSKNGIAIHALPEKADKPAIFNNLASGVVSQQNHIIVNDSAGRLDINNMGVLTSSTQALFKNTANGVIEANNTGTLNGFITSADDTVNLTQSGTWNNTDNSTLDTLVNTGTIQFVAPTDKRPLTISVDKYTGGGHLVVNSVWDDQGTTLNGVSTTDKLIIKTVEGNAVTQVKITADKLGTITPKSEAQFSSNVIEVENDHKGHLFVGTAATNSPQVAQLKREGNHYRWTLSAAGQNILDESVPSYVQQPFINQQMGFAQLGRLHERVGEQRYLAWDKVGKENHLWARTRYSTENLQGRTRFGAKVQSGFLQFGRDLSLQFKENNSQQHSGITLTYGWAKNKLFDKFRAENGVVTADKLTGRATTDMLSLGGYHTYYDRSNFYVDTVAQLSWLQNHYHSKGVSAKQNGYAVGASIEVGQAFSLLNPQVMLEPQAQLTYQYFWLNGFSDGIRHIKRNEQDMLTARLGVRATWNKVLNTNEPQLYFSANLLHHLTGSMSEITVGNQAVKEKFGRLSVELGLGGQLPLTSRLSLYGDIRYLLGIQDRNNVYRNSTLAREAYQGQLGLRYHW
ncbi:autotransporter family protein [Pasteurella multocida]|uniref:autotransporter family protein n=1 Tax=Pasteurella multocida TaxID=747 RepID=UPI00397839AB